MHTDVIRNDNIKNLTPKNCVLNLKSRTDHYEKEMIYPVKTTDLSAEPTASSVVKLLPGGFASVNSGTPIRQCRPCLPLFSPPRMTSQARPSLPIPVTYPSPRVNSGFLFVYFTKILQK